MQPAANQNTTVTAFPVPWAVKLIDKLHMLYGAKFMQQWAGIEKPKLALSWAEELTGFTGEEIATGLQACKNRPWPPTLPEFISLCRPSLDPEHAFREAVEGATERAKGSVGQWSHPAIYWAYVRIGAHDILNNGYQVIRKRWENALSDILAKGRWDAVPTPALQLTAPGQTTPTNAQAQAFVSELKRRTGLTFDAKGHIKDHKAWAQAIIDSGATGIRRKFAEQALGVKTA